MGQSKESGTTVLSTGGIAKAVVKKGVNSSIGGWLEDKGNKAIDRAINAAISMATGGAVSLRSWLASNWVDAIRVTVLTGIVTFVALKIGRACWGIWHTNLKLLSLIENGELSSPETAGSESSTPAGPHSETRAALPPTRGITVQLRSGSESGVCGIGIVNEPQIVFDSDGIAGPFKCECVVDFVGFSENAEASPGELSLTAPNGGPELVRLTIPNGQLRAKRHGSTRYEGHGVAPMMRQICAEMGTTLDTQLSSLSFETPRKCTLEVRIPWDDVSRERHKTSGIKLDFELFDQSFKPFVVQVRRKGTY